MRISLTLALLLALALVGCSQADDTEGVASLDTSSVKEVADEPAESPEVEAEQAMLDFTQCMREQGIDVDDPTMGADGNLQLAPIEIVGSAEGDVEEAMAEMDTVFAECPEHLAGATFGAPDPDAGIAFEDALVEYAGCMRDEGIDMPDPDFSGEGGVIDLGSATPGDQAEFESAHAECQEILAGAGLGF